jgi:hypothetical protein
MLDRIGELVRRGIFFPRAEPNRPICTLPDGCYRFGVRLSAHGVDRGELEVSLDVRRGASDQLAVTAHVRDGAHEPTDRSAFRFGLPDQGKVSCALDLMPVKLVDIWHASFVDKNPDQVVLAAHFSIRTDVKLRFGSQVIRDVQVILGAETNAITVHQWEKGPAKQHAIDSSATRFVTERDRFEMQVDADDAMKF